MVIWNQHAINVLYVSIAQTEQEMPMMSLSTSNVSTVTFRKRMCPSSSQSKSFNMNWDSAMNSFLVTTNEGEKKKNMHLRPRMQHYFTLPMYYQRSRLMNFKVGSAEAQIFALFSFSFSMFLLLLTPKCTSVSAEDLHIQIFRNGLQPSGRQNITHKLSCVVLCIPLPPLKPADAQVRLKWSGFLYNYNSQI